MAVGLVVLVTVVIIMTIKYLWERRMKLRELETLGIPGPKPNFWLGNKHEMINTGELPFLEKCTEKYGTVWGYYDGITPVAVVSDLEMIKEIAIKNFNSFHSRRGLDNVLQFAGSIVNTATLDDWKRLRAIAAPSFNAIRVKEMTPLINKSVDSIMELFEEKCQAGKPFDIYGDFQRMTLEAIATCGFSLDINTVKNPNSDILKKCREATTSADPLPLFEKLLTYMMFGFPGFADTYLVKKMIKEQTPIAHLTKWFRSKATEVITNRGTKPSTRADFSQNMLNAYQENQPGKMEAVESESKNSLKGITYNEMEINTALILITGYETTSTALGFVTYELAINPHIQKKLQNEIDEHFPLDPENCKPDFQQVHKLQYLDMVTKEVLRLHTIVVGGITRVCEKTSQVGGYTFPKGMPVQIDHQAIHMDPEHWGPEDPSLFVPERFSPERQEKRDPYAWLSFGLGPRGCPGFKFAQTEFKIAVIRTLKKYNIERCAETEVPIQKKKYLIPGPANGVVIKLTRRT